MAWLLREVFDYQTLTPDQKPEAINRLKRFIRAKPRILVKSISALEKAKVKLREKIHS